MVYSPFNYAQDYTNEFRWRAVGIGSLALAVSLTIGSIAIEKQWQKTLFLGSSLGLIGVSRLAEKARLDQARINTDVVDISDAGRQQKLYEYMTANTSNSAGPSTVLEIAPQMIDVPSDAGPVADYDEALPMYSLADIAGENHLAVIGGTGAGKSFLTQHLIKTYFAPGTSIIAMDTDAAPHEWPGLKVVGQAGNTDAIEGQMKRDLRDLDQRTKRRAQGEEVGPEVVRIIEELPTVTADIQDSLEAVDWKEAGEQKPENTATDWLKRMLRRGRKYKMMIVLVSQSFNVKSLKIGGEGDLRENLTVIYLGGKALKLLSKIKDKKTRTATEQWMKSQERPALVDVGGVLMRFPVPDLSGPTFEDDDAIDVQAYAAQRATTGASTTIRVDDETEVSFDFTKAAYKLIQSRLSEGATKTEVLAAMGYAGSTYDKGSRLWAALFDEFEG